MDNSLTVVVSGGVNWFADQERAYTVVIGDDGIEYIRSLKFQQWIPYIEPELLDKTSEPDCDDDEIITNNKKKRITAYNIFMKITMKTISVKYPNMPCKERMILAAELWKDAKNKNIYKMKL